MNENNYCGQVFINCPFDDDYRKIFSSIVFTIFDCGFVPRCSLEVSDATESRLIAIINLISECKYGIHDLSRVELDKNTNLPRFNMPFELGIFYGAKHFGQEPQTQKKCIVLEKEKYRYQKFISDLSGADIINHENSIKIAITSVRNWLVTVSKRTTIPDGKLIYARYQKFRVELIKICKENNKNFITMPFVEFTGNISDWLNINQHIPQRLFQ